jgi:hypothetical protein
MVTNDQKLRYINDFLSTVLRLRPFVSNGRCNRVFEVYCYFRKAQEFVRRGKSITPHNIRGRTFVAHSGPGNHMSASYLSVQESNGPVFDLFLNGEFRGKSGINHSPDIVLQQQIDRRIVSIYECKYHHHSLNLRYYREFIGYLQEMKLLARGHGTERNLYPEMRPCIYTSAVAPLSNRLIQEQYDFDVVDQL